MIEHTRLVDVVMGGPGREAAVSRNSGAAVAAGLRRAGYDVAEIDCQGQCSPARLRPGAVIFNIIHGTYGEDGQLQEQLEAAGRCYVGSDAVASRLCMDKQATKDRLQAAGLPVPWGISIDPAAVHDSQILKLASLGPLVLKPRADGSSVGLHLLPSVSFLLPALEQSVRELGPVPMLLEERLTGDEFTVGIIEDAGGDLRILPPLCIRPHGNDGYDYAAKYTRDDTRKEEVTEPARRRRLQELAEAAFRACHCRDLARVDLMAGADGACRIIEINTLPGFTDHSLLPKAAALAGIDFSQLVSGLVAAAASRCPAACQGAA